MKVGISESARIDAPPEVVYGIIADYHGGHPSILPEGKLTDLVVLEGGMGAGTRIRFALRILGQTRIVEADVTEPEPGRVLEEIDRKTGAVTRFTVDRIEEGRSSCVTIETTWEKPWLLAWIDRLTAPPLLRSMYRTELSNLDRAARTHAHAAG